MKRKAIVLILALFVLSLGGTDGQPTRLVLAGGGCLTVENENPHIDKKLILQSCNRPNQGWSRDGDLYRTQLDTTMCMQAGRVTVTAPQEGTQVRLFACDSNNALQKFELLNSHDGVGSKIRLQDTDICVDHQRVDATAQQDIILRSCSAAAGKWRTTPPSPTPPSPTPTTATVGDTERRRVVYVSPHARQDRRVGTSGKKGSKKAWNPNPFSTIISRPTTAPPTTVPPTTVPPTTAPNSLMTAPPEATNTESPTQEFELTVCKIDEFGLYVPPNNPNYYSPGSTNLISTSSVTLSDASSAISNVLGTISTVLGVVGAVAALSTGPFGTAVLAAAAAVVGAFLGVFDQLPDTDDLILKEIRDGFMQIDSRLTDIQLQIRAGFLALSELIGDVTLDAYFTRLDSLTRSFNNYMQATPQDRFAVYDYRLRSICNDPHNTPEDIFYDLYGYVCSTCEYGVRKRADLLQVYSELNPIAGAEGFINSYSKFIQFGLMQAMLMHTLCLSPILGACIDKTTDQVFQNGMVSMQKALAEAEDNLNRIIETYPSWVNAISPDDIIPYVRDGNKATAEAIRDFLVGAQPNYHIQVIVSANSEDASEENIWRSACQKGGHKCFVQRDSTGHFFFSNVEGKQISIRYRNSTLALPSTTTELVPGTEGAPGSRTEPISDFFDKVVARVNHDDEAAAVAYCSDRNRICAVHASFCIRCADSEKIAFASAIGPAFFIHRTRRDGDTNYDKLQVRQANSNTDAFPSAEMKFFLPTECVLFCDSENDDFRVYY